MLKFVFGETDVTSSQTGQPINLVPMSSLPVQADLADMLRIAHLNPGRSVCLEWKIAPRMVEHLLEAIFLSPASDAIPEWNLYRLPSSEASASAGESDESAVTHVWTNRTDNLNLLIQLLTVEENSGAPPTVSKLSSLADSIQAGQSPSAVSISSSNSLPSSSKDQQSVTGGMKPITNLRTEYTPIPATKAEVAAATSKRFTSSDLVAIDENALAKGVVLAGDLAEVELPGVLQSIKICKMSGRLDLQEGSDQAEIFFDDGELVHAALHSALANDVSDKGSVGDQVVLDVLTWERGNFYFNPGRKTFEKAVTRRLEALLLEGASLRDFGKYLRGLGVTNDCVLEYRQCLADSALEEKLINGIPIDFAHQLRLYSAIDGKTNFGTMLKRLSMPKSLWMPILFNLFNYDLIALSGAAQPQKTGFASIPTIEQSIVKEAAKSLVRSETGLYPYALLLHFLQREHARYMRSHSPFAIAIVEIKNDGEVLSDAALLEVSKCFDSIKENFDILGHYRISEMIMLLPLRDDRETRKFVESLAEKVKLANLPGVKAPQNLRISCGIASVPGGNDQLASLLKDVEAAKAYALSSKALCSSSREVRWQAITKNAEIAFNARDYVEAELLLSAAFSESEHFPTDDPRVILTIDKLCEVLDMQEKFAMAEPMLSLKLLLKTRSFGAHHPEVLSALRELIRCYCQQAKYQEAETALHSAIDRIRQSTSFDHLDMANALYSLASVCQAQQKFEEAESACNQAVEVLKKALGPEHPETVKASKTQTDLAKLLHPESHQKALENERHAASSNQASSSASQINGSSGQFNTTPSAS